MINISGYPNQPNKIREDVTFGTAVFCMQCEARGGVGRNNCWCESIWRSWHLNSSLRCKSWEKSEKCQIMLLFKIFLMERPCISHTFGEMKHECEKSFSCRCWHASLRPCLDFLRRGNNYEADHTSTAHTLTTTDSALPGMKCILRTALSFNRGNAGYNTTQLVWQRRFSHV